MDIDKINRYSEHFSKLAEPKTEPFGFQLLLDFYNCTPGACDDLDLCYNFLDKIVDDLGMEKQSPPNIFRGDKKYPDKAGLSGWVPLIESSVVIHTLSPKEFISIDIYCCKAFDPKKAEELCKEYFHPQRVEHQFVERGLNYYKIDTKHHTIHVQNGEAKVHIKEEKGMLELKK
jgi:S-adenosylmethionine/arginine decarboxylase-like enzyme